MLSEGHCGKTTAFDRTQTLKCVLYVAVELCCRTYAFRKYRPWNPLLPGKAVPGFLQSRILAFQVAFHEFVDTPVPARVLADEAS